MKSYLTNLKENINNDEELMNKTDIITSNINGLIQNSEWMSLKLSAEYNFIHKKIQQNIEQQSKVDQLEQKDSKKKHKPKAYKNYYQHNKQKVREEKKQK